VQYPYSVISYDRLNIDKACSDHERPYWVPILVLLRVYTSTCSAIGSHCLIPIRPLVPHVFSFIPVNTPYHFWTDQGAFSDNSLQRYHAI